MLRVVSIGLLTAFAAAASLALVGFAAAPQLFDPAPNLYRGADMRFELPRGWKCVLEQTEWVCKLEAKSEASRAAVIIFTRQLRNDSDTLDAYEAHLRQPRELKSTDGKTHMSKVIYVHRVKHGPHTWVDGKHLNSEIFNYYTRYLATTTSHTAILVSYSVHRKHAAELEPQLERAFESLKINQRD